MREDGQYKSMAIEYQMLEKTKELPGKVLDGVGFPSHGGHPIFLNYILKEM